MKLIETQSFLHDLVCNNKREWFNENKSRYLKAKAEFETFVAGLIPLVKSIDPFVNVHEPGECIYRIYRNLRFSKDKTPYKNYFSAFINRDGKKSPFAGYYIHIEPDASLIAAGTNPDKTLLLPIRTAIFKRAGEFKRIISDERFRRYLSLPEEGKLKRAPKGFPADFAEIDLLKYKHYAAVCPLEDDFWTGDNLYAEIREIFGAALPFNRFINAALGGNIQ